MRLPPPVGLLFRGGDCFSHVIVPRTGRIVLPAVFHFIRMNRSSLGQLRSDVNRHQVETTVQRCNLLRFPMRRSCDASAGPFSAIRASGWHSRLFLVSHGRFPRPRVVVVAGRAGETPNQQMQTTSLRLELFPFPKVERGARIVEHNRLNPSIFEPQYRVNEHISPPARISLALPQSAVFLPAVSVRGYRLREDGPEIHRTALP